MDKSVNAAVRTVLMSRAGTRTKAGKVIKLMKEKEAVKVMKAVKAVKTAKRAKVEKDEIKVAEFRVDRKSVV